MLFWSVSLSLSPLTLVSTQAKTSLYSCRLSLSLAVHCTNRKLHVHCTSVWERKIKWCTCRSHHTTKIHASAVKKLNQTRMMLHVTLMCTCTWAYLYSLYCKFTHEHVCRVLVQAILGKMLHRHDTCSCYLVKEKGHRYPIATFDLTPFVDPGACENIPALTIAT